MGLPNTKTPEYNTISKNVHGGAHAPLAPPCSGMYSGLGLLHRNVCLLSFLSDLCTSSMLGAIFLVFFLFVCLFVCFLTNFSCLLPELKASRSHCSPLCKTQSGPYIFGYL